MEPLRAQSEKAAQFLEYAGEKKTLEISLWVLTLDKSRAVLREQEDKIDRAVNRAGTARGHNAGARAVFDDRSLAQHQRRAAAPPLTWIDR